MIQMPMIDELQIITAAPIPLVELGVTLRQPTAREIALLGEEQYFIALKLFLMSTKDLKIRTQGVSNWDIFQQVLKQKVDGVADVRNLISNFIKLFFVENASLGPRSIIVQTKKGISNIEPEDFDVVQAVVRQLGGADLLVPQEEIFRPKNKKAAEIAEKMKKARKRLARVKAIESGQDPDAPKKADFLGKYIRSLAVVTANSVEQLSNMTLLQINTLMETYLAYEQYNIEVQQRMIPMVDHKNDKPLIHWMMQDKKKEDSGIGTI